MNFHKRMITVAACVNLLLIPFAMSVEMVTTTGNSIHDLEDVLFSLKHQFLTALANGDGVSARQAQYIFNSNRNRHLEIFRNKEAEYYKALKFLENPSSDEVWVSVMVSSRVYIWQTVYEDAAKMGISQEKIASILAADPNRGKLLKLKKLKDEGLITEQEYETKRKAIINGL